MFDTAHARTVRNQIHTQTEIRKDETTTKPQRGRVVSTTEQQPHKKTKKCYDPIIFDEPRMPVLLELPNVQRGKLDAKDDLNRNFLPIVIDYVAWKNIIILFSLQELGCVNIPLKKCQPVKLEQVLLKKKKINKIIALF